MNKVEIILEPADNTRLQNLCGPLNNNLKELELRFDVEINQRGNLFYFVGNKKNILIASETLKELYTEAEKKEISVDILEKKMGLALSPPLSPQQNTQLLDLVCEIKELQKRDPFIYK